MAGVMLFGYIMKTFMDQRVTNSLTVVRKSLTLWL